MLDLLVFVVEVPFRAWCFFRHKRPYWRINRQGYDGWICQRDGFDWPFSKADFKRFSRV